MIRRIFLSIVFILAGTTFLFAQQMISGTVTDLSGTPIEGVAVKVQDQTVGTTTNSRGLFELQLYISDSVWVEFLHVSFQSIGIWIKDETLDLDIRMEDKSTLLNPVEILGNPRQTVGLISISGRSFLEAPSGNNDINSILKTLPGVVSNNELSSNYSVRGGNFDENLIFINEIPVYRPFLISNGRQEGLGSVNSDMVDNVEFSTGGWSSVYGGRLSSVLRAQYKQPNRNSLRASAGLLGGDLTAGMKGNKWSVLSGIRYKSSQYLLNTFETQGEYQPRFADIQTIVNFSPTTNTNVSLFLNYAQNRFLVIPSSRTSEFGTFNQSFRLFVAYEGREIMNYDTWQGAITIKQNLSDRWQVNLVASRVNSIEEESVDVEGGYRLCDIDRGSGNEDCLITRGIGTEYRYGRNQLNAAISDFRLVSDHQLNLNNDLSWGIDYKTVDIDDVVDEYSFVDSSDYVTSLERIDSDNKLSYNILAFFLNHQIRSMDRTLEWGVRTTYSGVSDEWLVAPRLRFIQRLSPRSKIQLATGIYYQPPFYRELRGNDGMLNTVRAQSSIHFIAGYDRNFQIWQRPFQWKVEAYLKELRNSIPYDIQNVRVRYLPDLLASGRIQGIDSRIGGEFIPGTESWFSMSVLSAREDIDGDERGLIRKPTDQRLTLGILFRDHLPNNPSVRVTMNLQVGTGLPFGPPGDLSNRNVFTGRIYRRLDLGFTKEFNPDFGDVFISLEILNVLGVDNVITYNWITDIVNQQIAVPNALSGRFFNLKASINL